MNLFWPVYKNLEKELLLLAENIHIDDKQLNVYSVKIAELLIRTAVEIEAISKELYFQNGGTGKKDEIYFDTDCIQHLENKWSITKKEIIVASPYLYFEKDKNKILAPLKKVNIRGKGDWKKAYQAVKHDRANSLAKGNLKSFIDALGSLYILNIYYKGDEDLKNIQDRKDLNLGSDIFAPSLTFFSFFMGMGKYEALEEKYICIQKYQNSDYLKIQECAQNDLKKQKQELFTSQELKNYLRENPSMAPESVEVNTSLIKKTIGMEAWTKITLKHATASKLANNLKPILVLNKNQEIYPEIPPLNLKNEENS